MHVASLGLDYACSVARSAVHVEYAAGPTIALDEFRSWMAEQVDVRLSTMIFQSGAIDFRFPNVDVSEKKPIDSFGLQMVDLLLWHQRRLRARKDPVCEDLLDRAALHEDMAWEQKDGPMENWVATKNRPARVTSRPAGRPARDWQHWTGLLFTIEQYVHELARLDCVVPHVAHLMPRVRAASASMRGYLGADHARYREFLRVFLLVADTLPAYGDDPQVQQDVADAIYVATSMDDLRRGECVSRLGQWAQIRQAKVADLGWEAPA